MSAHPSNFEIPPTPIAEFRAFFGDADSLGELADIVMPDADDAALRRFFDLVVPQYPHVLTLTDCNGGVTNAWPNDRGEVIDLAGSDTGPWPSLVLRLPSVDVRALINPEWIELDVPRRVYDDNVYGDLATLMCRCGDAMDVDVFVTPEMSSCEGIIVYEHRVRTFRKPHRGLGTSGNTRDHILTQFRDALAPFTNPSTPVSDADARAVARRMEQFFATYGELALQDALSVEEQRAIDQAWSAATGVTTPAAGIQMTREFREHCERGLRALAKQYVARDTP
jgi:hypothetical protein